ARNAFGIGEAGDAPVTAIAVDDELQTVGLKKPFMARARRSPPSGTDPAEWLLERAASGLVAQLDSAWPEWRTRRLGIVVGTSSGGMAPLTEALRMRASGEEPPPDLARRVPYFGPLIALESRFPGPSERVQVLAACASSAV